MTIKENFIKNFSEQPIDLEKNLITNDFKIISRNNYLGRIVNAFKFNSKSVVSSISTTLTQLLANSISPEQRLNIQTNLQNLELKFEKNEKKKPNLFKMFEQVFRTFSILKIQSLPETPSNTQSLSQINADADALLARSQGILARLGKNTNT